MSNITQVVNVEKNMRMLKKGVHASDLDQLLSSTGPFTLFAPTDAAFEKLAKGMMENLLEPQNRVELTQLINNHIIMGKVLFDDLTDGLTLKTAGGKSLQVQVKEGTVSIGESNIQLRNGKISNGLVHVIDTVLA
ncbi:MAG: fasciclin domain-containing protein [Chitinophagaceae bacterium]|nr:fasciclin domain-containing protein [Chitinophagaceae bacterium]